MEESRAAFSEEAVAKVSLFCQAVYGHMDIHTVGKRVSEHFV